MAGKISDQASMLARLESLFRNNYFYGKLLTERDLTVEQSYMNRKRWLVNRLGLGSGVLCGLEVEISQDGQCVLIHPGAALDPLGREIIVPEAYCLTNPRQPTDCLGKPSGDPISGAGTLYLCVAYQECDSEPVPVLVSDCDTREGCAANMTRERYRFGLCTDVPLTPGLGETCVTIFPQEPDEGFSHRLAAEQALQGACPQPETECVVLADILLPADGQGTITVDMFAHRQVIYSNVTLLDLLLCLAERVDQCCGVTPQVKVLRYVSGDAQSGPVSGQLKDAVVVQVVDGSQQAVANEAVTFKVRGGGGQIPGGSPTLTVNSDASGNAKASWQLGPNAGLNTLEATISNGGSVVFSATGNAAAPPKPPVILKTNPANGDSLNPADVGRLLEGGMQIIFSQEMHPKMLSAPANWLGMWLVSPPILTANAKLVMVDRVDLQYRDQSNGGPDAKPFYQVKVPPAFTNGLSKLNLRVLVAVSAKNDNIDSAASKILLDAEFSGTPLNLLQTGLYAADANAVLLDALFRMGAGQRDTFNSALYSILAPTGTPPTAPAIPAAGTGDGNPGGNFHSFFTIA
jgi:hypothetical protein